MQDQYVQGTIPYADVHVADCLCKGGAITYQVKKEANISDEWILQFVVVPNIARNYSNKVALVLGHALLWHIYYGPYSIQGSTIKLITSLAATRILL